MRKKIFRQSSISKKHERPSVDLTPLIDVVFVILFAFIILAPLLKIDVIELVQSANTKDRSSVKSSPIQIAIDKNQNIYFNNEKISFQQLENILTAHFKKSPDTIPILLQDQNAPFNSYYKVKELLERLGYQRFHLVVK